MYIKVQVYPAAYGPVHGMERYHFAEVGDDFNEWPQQDKDRVIDELREEAVWEYVETIEEILEGDFEEDEDY